jgi:hypothetical protein
MYESPEILATYSDDELTAEAAVCQTYGVVTDVVR